MKDFPTFWINGSLGCAREGDFTVIDGHLYRYIYGGSAVKVVAFKPLDDTPPIVANHAPDALG